MTPGSGVSGELVYRIDASSTIVSLSENWDSWYVENSPSGTQVPTWLGTRLWQHLGDASTIHLYQSLVAQARRTRREVVVPFRCDAPEKRRFMQMQLRSVEAGMVEFRTTIMREELRETVTMFDPRACYSDEMLRICSWCKKVPLPEWVEIEEAVLRLRLFDTNTLPRITHTICPDCAALIRKEIDLLK